IESMPGVVCVTGIAGRMLADITVIEAHIDVDPMMSVAEGGRVVDEIKCRLISEIPGINHVVVEMNSSIHEPEGLNIPRPPTPSR
ncbi:MAG: cation transporter dimerization domain-containing protein, partial [Dehalococcoidia bacterium]